MKKAIVMWLAFCSVAMAAYEYVWVDTNTGIYKPARVEADQHRNVQATTGQFDVLYVAGVRITGTSTSAVPAITDDPISGLETDGQVPGTIVMRDIPTRYALASFWYPFDYDSTVILDASGSGFHAVNRPAESPMVWYDYALTSSKIGENFLVQVNTNGVANLTPNLTCGAWLNLDSEATNNNVLLSAGGASNRVSIWMDATNIYSVVMGTGVQTSTLIYAYSTGLGTGIWHRLVTSYEKKGGTGTATAEHKLWLDGDLVASDTAAPNFFVGNRNRFMLMNTDGTPTQNKFVDGMIDDPFVIRSIWVGADVTNDWEAGRSMGKWEYAKSVPYPVSAISPINGANTTTGASQILSWSVSSVAEEYRLNYWTNGYSGTGSISQVSNRFDIGATVNNRTNYWQVLASNSFGMSTSSVFAFYPFTFATNLYTNFALYAGMRSDLSTYAADLNPRLGLDNLKYFGGAHWSDYATTLNSDSFHDDYLATTGTVALSSGSPNFAFSIGFFMRIKTGEPHKICLFTESSPGFAGPDHKRTSAQYDFTTGWLEWNVRSTNNYGSSYYVQNQEIDYSTAPSGLGWGWNHLAFTCAMVGANVVRQTIWLNGVAVSTADTPFYAFNAPQIVSPFFIGMNPSEPNVDAYYGLNPDIEIDDVFVVERELTAAEMANISSQNRSLNVAY